MPFIAPEDEASPAGGFVAPEDQASEINDESALMAAGRGALRNIPLAQQAVAGVKGLYAAPGEGTKAYSDELADLTQKAETAKAAHPVAYGAGAAAGTVAPLLIPGAGEALEAAPMLGNAALGAAQGISDTNLAKNPGLAAKQAGIGGAVGAGTAGILGKLSQYFAGKAAPAVAKAIEPEATKAVEAAPAAQAAGAPVTKTPGNILPDATPVAPDFVPSADRIAASNWARGIGFTPRKFQAFARELGENPQTAALEGQKWSQEKGLIKLFDHPGQALERVSKIKESAGKEIGEIIDKFGTEPVPAQEIKGELEHLADVTANQNAEASLLKVTKRIDQLSERGVLDWRAMNEIKGMIGQEIGEHPAISKAYGLLAERMNGMVDATAERIGNPGLRVAYETAKRDFRMGSLLEPALKYSESKNLIGGPSGHNTLRGVLGQLTEAMTGTPPLGQVTRNAIAKSAPIIKAIGKAPAQAKAAGLKKLPQAAQMELANYLQSNFK